MAQPRFVTEKEVEGGVIPIGGTTEQVLAKKSNTNYDLKWKTATGSGDVVGPDSATDGNLAVFDGTSGKIIKDGGAPGGGGGLTVWDGSATTGTIYFHKGGLWKSLTDNDVAPSITDETNWSHLSGDVDLGLVDLHDAAVNGRNNVLIPYADGRIIKGLRFIPGGLTVPLNFSLYFATPNTGAAIPLSVGNGMAFLDHSVLVDTERLEVHGQNLGINYDGTGGLENTGAENQIPDVGPLIFGAWLSGFTNFFLPIGSWQANTPYCDIDSIIDPNGRLQIATNVNIGPGNGVTGSTIPTFAFPITAINQGTNTFTVSGDASSYTGSILVFNSADNNGTYTIVSATFDTDHTDIVISESIPSPTVDGLVTIAPGNGGTHDGTVIWSDSGPIPSGSIHAIAEVIEGVSPMPLYPATIEFVAAPQNGVAGSTLPDITVIVKDQNGDPYKFLQLTISLAFYGDGAFTGPVASTTANTDQTTGIATFSAPQIDTPGTYVLRVNTFPVLSADPIFSDPFDITAP